jgi:predicted enzyme related to lactoylglutathione lyase
MSAQLFRVLVRVSNIEEAAAFYDIALGVRGHRVSPGRHHYQCGQTELALYDPVADGDVYDTAVSPNETQIYFAMEDLEDSYKRVKSSPTARVFGEIELKPWGERTFWASDPSGNRLCFVDARTLPGPPR